MDRLTALDNLFGLNPGATLTTPFFISHQEEEILNALDHLPRASEGGFGFAAQLKR